MAKILIPTGLTVVQVGVIKALIQSAPASWTENLWAVISNRLGRGPWSNTVVRNTVVQVLADDGVGIVDPADPDVPVFSVPGPGMSKVLSIANFADAGPTLSAVTFRNVLSIMGFSANSSPTLG